MKNYTLLLLFVFTISGSCKKALEQQPDDRTELNSPVKVAELLTTAYPQANYIPFAEAMSDNAGDKGEGGYIKVDMDNTLPWSFSDSPEPGQDSPNYYWRACYAAIAAANHALEAIEKAPDPLAYSASKGEALVARAYAHFMLVTFFAKVYDPLTADTDPGIPYVTSPEKVVQPKYDRKTVAYVYEQIEKDLTEGIPLLRNQSYKIPKYHFTTTAAHAFASRFYLFKQNYQQVINHANAAFPGTTISANLRPWNDTYYIEKAGRPDFIKADYTRSSTNANLLLTEAPSEWGGNYALYKYGLNLKIRRSVLGNDNPLQKALAFQVFGATELYYNIPKFREHFVKQSISANFGVGYNMIPLFTAEEVLFNRAEANAMLSNYDAVLTDLNAYLSKRIEAYDPAEDDFTLLKATEYYNTDPKTALVFSILNYKRQEYMHEGLRWFDILRHKIPVIHQSKDGGTTYTLSATDPRRALQIPKEAAQAGIALNPR